MPLREQRIAAIQVRPARLHHADSRFGEMVNGLMDDLRWRNEIRVEHRDELAGGGLEPFPQCPGLEAFAIRAVKVADVVPGRGHAIAAFSGDLRGLASGSRGV